MELTSFVMGAICVIALCIAYAIGRAVERDKRKNGN